MLWGGSGKDVLVGAEGTDIAYGGAGRDKVNGNDGNDTLYGGNGNDVLKGGPKNDLLVPGKGRDKVFGNSGDDTVSYAGSSKGVLVDLDKNKLKKGAKGDDIRQVENVIGSEGKDTLTPDKGGKAFGGAGNDVIKSAQGAVMRGDAGKDKLKGDGKEKYADTFWLQKPGDGSHDVIFKFDRGQDKLRIDGSDFGLGKSLSGDELVNRPSGHAGSGDGPQLIYDKSNKTLWYDADGGGAGGAVQIAKFKGGPGSLGSGDFDLV